MKNLFVGQSWLEGGGKAKAAKELFKIQNDTEPLSLVGASHLNGIFSFLILVMIVAIILFFRKNLTKIFSKNKSWYIYGGVSVPIFIGGRYLPFIIQSIRAPKGTWTHDMIFQNIFATNLCAFLLVIISIIIFVPKLRNTVGKWIAPWCFLGGILTMFGLSISKSANNFIVFFLLKQSLPWGSSIPSREIYDSYQYFSSHAWLIITSILILITIKKYNFNDLGLTMLFILFYAAYAFTIIGFSHLSDTPIQHDVAGLLPADWQLSKENVNLNAVNYPGVFRILNLFRLKGVSAVIFGLFFFIIMALLISLMQYRFIMFRGKPTKFKEFISKKIKFKGSKND